MTYKRIILLAAFSLAVVSAGLSIASSSKSKRNSFPTQEQALTQTRPQDPTTLSSRIKIAKAKGDRQVVFPGPIPIYDDFGSLDEAIANYEIVVARPIEKVSFLLDPRDITSFYRLEIMETLSPQKLAKCCFPKDAPNELLPLNTNEVYLRVGGGTLMLDGI